MPKVFDIGPYTIYFWVGEGNLLESVHVHITEGTPSPNDTKFWITRSGGAILCHNKGNIALKRLRDIQSIVESQHRLIVEKWIAKFGEIVKGMNMVRQISQRIGWAMGAQTRSAADYYINATISIKSDPFDLLARFDCDKR